jgi:hypothetical protein
LSSGSGSSTTTAWNEEQLRTVGERRSEEGVRAACLVRVTVGSVGARSGARAAAVVVRRRRSPTLRREKRRGRGDGAMPVRRQRPWTVVPLIGRVRHRCGKKCNDTARYYTLLSPCRYYTLLSPCLNTGFCIRGLGLLLGTV